MKNKAELKRDKPVLQRQDAVALRKRATEDAVKDADTYASSSRPLLGKAKGSDNREALAYLLSPKQPQVRVDTQDEIDGLLIRSCEGLSKLVLSDEVSEVSLVAEAKVLAAEPLRIFHVQGPAPWVQQVHPGEA